MRNKLVRKALYPSFKVKVVMFYRLSDANVSTIDLGSLAHTFIR